MLEHGYWQTYWDAPEGGYQRVFDQLNKDGNILVADWIAPTWWAVVALMGHRTIIGTAMRTSRDLWEIRELGEDGKLKRAVYYSQQAIYSIEPMEKEEARTLVMGGEGEGEGEGNFAADIMGPPEYGPKEVPF